MIVLRFPFDAGDEIVSVGHSESLCRRSESAQLHAAGDAALKPHYAIVMRVFLHEFRILMNDWGEAECIRINWRFDRTLLHRAAIVHFPRPFFLLASALKARLFEAHRFFSDESLCRGFS